MTTPDPSAPDSGRSASDAALVDDTSHFQRVLRRNLTLPLTVGAISAVVFVALIAYLLNTITWVEHTQRVLSGANQLTTLTADLETGTRGFLLTGDESFLAPYNVGKPKLVAQMDMLIREVADNPPQVDRLRRIQQLQLQWDTIADRLIQARRQSKALDVMAPSQAGKQLFDEMRREFADFTAAEESLLKERSDTSHNATVWTVIFYVVLTLLASGVIATLGRRQMVALSDTFGSALAHQRQAAERLAQQAWLRAGQAQLSDRLIGQLTLPMLGEQSLAFMAGYFGAVVAAFYVRTEGGRLDRIASYGFGKAQATSPGTHTLLPNEGLVAQVARDGKTLHLDNLPQGYLQVSSGLGDGPVSQIIVAPTVDGGEVNGVFELGFLRPVAARDLSLAEMLGEPIGAAVEAALYRHRLQQALEETRQLNEEMQVQQEELRAANEELAEHSTVLMTAQGNLENQQAELEGTNAELARQAAVLDLKNEALHQAQADLQQHADELQRASRYKSEFLANMSHELRTPLNSSLILAKLLSENKTGNLNEEQLKFARIIYSAGNDLLTLINDIL
ncbi:MAG: chemotaxis protein CheY, partial [Rhizobacter sp.]|nr:chemotaxis protein CheY [Rhizobacter sp.]